MKKGKAVFKGFDKELFRFLDELKKNNNLEWFHKNKSRYLEYLVEPAKLYVSELTPFLSRINPAIRNEPKFNKTLMRMNKDMRFAKGAPYRTYFLIHFGRFKMDSEYFLYFAPGEVQIGLFLNKSSGGNLHFKENFERYRKEIVEIFSENKLNNKYSLYTMDKEPELVLDKFNAGKHISEMEKFNYVLLQKVTPPNSKIFSDELLPYSVKLFSELYPLLCFAYFKNPLKEIEKFKETFGIIV